MIKEIRLLIAEKFLYWAVCIAPKNKAGSKIAKHVNNYATDIVHDLPPMPKIELVKAPAEDQIKQPTLQTPERLRKSL